MTPDDARRLAANVLEALWKHAGDDVLAHPSTWDEELALIEPIIAAALARPHDLHQHPENGHEETF